MKHKQLRQVEQAFREMKSAAGYPACPSPEEWTIRGHVFCGFLALLLMKELISRLEYEMMYAVDITGHGNLIDLLQGSGIPPLQHPQGRKRKHRALRRHERAVHEAPADALGPRGRL